MFALTVQIGVRDTKVDQINLVHLLYVVLEVADHNIVGFQITVYVPFVMKLLEEVHHADTNANHRLDTEMLLVPTNQIINIQPQLLQDDEWLIL